MKRIESCAESGCLSSCQGLGSGQWVKPGRNGQLLRPSGEWVLPFGSIAEAGCLDLQLWQRLQEKLPTMLPVEVGGALLAIAKCQLLTVAHFETLSDPLTAW